MIIGEPSAVLGRFWRKHGIFAKRWVNLMKELNCKNSEPHFVRLFEMYSKRSRAYHNIEHLEQCLKEFDAFKNLSENPNQLEFAIWHHDAVYDPKMQDNEEESASLAYRNAIESKLSFEFADNVEDLIIATKHIKKPETTEEKLIVDIDLSIFGQPTDIFDEYELNIRKEYEFYPLEIYKPGRTKILQGFLDREHIYQTPEIREKYEAKARENLQRSIEKLKS